MRDSSASAPLAVGLKAPCSCFLQDNKVTEGQVYVHFSCRTTRLLRARSSGGTSRLPTLTVCCCSKWVGQGAVVQDGLTRGGEGGEEGFMFASDSVLLFNGCGRGGGVGGGWEVQRTRQQSLEQPYTHVCISWGGVCKCVAKLKGTRLGSLRP